MFGEFGSKDGDRGGGVYDYRGELGELLFRVKHSAVGRVVLRDVPGRPGEFATSLEGGWYVRSEYQFWRLEGPVQPAEIDAIELPPGRLVPYRFSALLAAPKQPVIVVGDESAADALAEHGLLTTT